MHPFDHAYALLVAIALPAFAARYTWPKLHEHFAELSARERAVQYWTNSAALLGLAGLALWLWEAQNRDFAGLGLARGDQRAVVVLAVGGVLLVGLAGVYVRALRDAKTRRRALEQILREAPIVPRERRDLPHWTFVSVAAGVGEEIIYRGFLIWYLSRVMSPAAAVVASAAIFAVAHLYQGPRSAIKVGVLALALGAGYVWCGVLWPVMVAHFAVDLVAGVFAVRLHELERADGE
jgi:membrane protease YdiL (CAAX protease family)